MVPSSTSRRGRLPGASGVRCLLPALVLAAGLSGPAAAEVIYRWTDDDGTVHYSDAPPPGREDVEKLEVQPEAPPPEGGRPQESEEEKAPSASDVNITQAEIRVQKLKKRVEQAKEVYEQARQNRIEGEKIRLGSEQNYVRYLERIEKLKEQENQARKELDSLRRKLEQARNRLDKLREQKKSQ